MARYSANQRTMIAWADQLGIAETTGMGAADSSWNSIYHLLALALGGSPAKYYHYQKGKTIPDDVKQAAQEAIAKRAGQSAPQEDASESALESEVNGLLGRVTVIRDGQTISTHSEGGLSSVTTSVFKSGRIKTSFEVPSE